MKIFIVEDDTELQNYIKTILKASGFEFDSALSPAEFEAKSGSWCYDMVLLDLKLDNSEHVGVDICKKIKDAHPQAAIVVLSALTENELKLKVFNMGVDDYICKPFYDEELLSRIKRVAQRRNIPLPQSETRIVFDDTMNVVVIDKNRAAMDKDEYVLFKFLYLKKEKGIKYEHLAELICEDPKKEKAKLVSLIESLNKKLSSSGCQIENKNEEMFLSLGAQVKEKTIKKKILIADSDDVMQDLLKGILIENGYECITTTEGNNTLKQFYEVSPDLVILDIKLPNINGFKLVELMKKINKKIGIIILTARFLEPSDISLGLDLGADDYLPKTIEPTELLARVQAILKNYDVKM